jgi:hypothetical protein
MGCPKICMPWLVVAIVLKGDFVVDIEHYGCKE